MANIILFAQAIGKLPKENIRKIIRVPSHFVVVADCKCIFEVSVLDVYRQPTIKGTVWELSGLGRGLKDQQDRKVLPHSPKLPISKNSPAGAIFYT